MSLRETEVEAGQVCPGGARCGVGRGWWAPSAAGAGPTPSSLGRSCSHMSAHISLSTNLLRVIFDFFHFLHFDCCAALAFLLYMFTQSRWRGAMNSDVQQKKFPWRGRPPQRCSTARLSPTNQKRLAMSSKPFHTKEDKLVVHRRFLWRVTADN